MHVAPQVPPPGQQPVTRALYVWAAAYATHDQRVHRGRRSIVLGYIIAVA